MNIAPKTRSATILEKRNLTGNIWLIRFRCEDNAFSFTPGQYATVIIDEKTRRQYSFASPPTSLPEGEFLIDTTPMGKGSVFFLRATVGMKFQMLAPLGTFGVRNTPAKKVLVATGTGIAPFRSMLRNAIFNSQFSILNKNLNIQNQKQITINQELGTKNQDLRSTTYTLYWGLRHEDDIYLGQEFETLTSHLTGFQYFVCLSKPEETWNGMRGHVTEHVLSNEANDAEFYLCGNKGMVEELSADLKNRGVDEKNIKTDVFF